MAPLRTSLRETICEEQISALHLKVNIFSYLHARDRNGGGLASNWSSNVRNCSKGILLVPQTFRSSTTSTLVGVESSVAESSSKAEVKENRSDKDVAGPLVGAVGGEVGDRYILIGSVLLNLCLAAALCYAAFNSHQVAYVAAPVARQAAAVAVPSMKMVSRKDVLRGAMAGVAGALAGAVNKAHAADLTDKSVKKICSANPTAAVCVKPGGYATSKAR